MRYYPKIKPAPDCPTCNGEGYTDRGPRWFWRRIRCDCVMLALREALKAGRDPGGTCDLFSRCSGGKSVEVLLPDGNVIKRRLRKDRVWLEKNCPEALLQPEVTP